jgi:hypothetical protein
MQHPCVADDAHRTIDDVPQNRFQTPAAYLDPDRSHLRAGDGLLLDHAQSVEGDHGAEHDDLVHTKFARGQLPDPEFAFEFAVELLTGAVIVIQQSDFLRRTGQFCPVGVHLDLRYQQAVAIVVGQAFNHFEGNGDLTHIGLRTSRTQVIDKTGVDVLAFACVTFEFTHTACRGQLLLRFSLTQVAFDYEVIMALHHSSYSRLIRKPVECSGFLSKANLATKSQQVPSFSFFLFHFFRSIAPDFDS